MLTASRRPLASKKCVSGETEGAVTRWAVPVLDQPSQQELRRRLHDRIGTGAQEMLIAVKSVVLPQMQAKPGPPHGPVGPYRIADSLAYRSGFRPQVSVVMSRPPAEAVIDLCGNRAGDAQMIHQVEQRFVQFAQVTRFPPASSSFAR